MNYMSFRESVSLAALVASITALPSYAAEAATEAPEEIEEIIVFGEKAERSLKDTASSVAVISSDILETGQYLSISNALKDIPNVVSLTGAAADIRGVSGNGGAGGFNGVSGGARPRVLTLVDGVAEPLVGDLTGDTGMWDIQQIEVFRGPQSTTNGRNSIGGSVYVKTKDPSFDWEGAVKAGYRNKANYYHGAAALSGPLVEDKLAFRLSAEYVDGETYNDKLIFDANPTDLDLNEVKTSRIRGKLLWQPNGTDDLQILYKFAYRDEKGDTGRNYVLGDDPSAGVPLFQRYADTDSVTNSIKLDYKISDSYAIDLLVAHMDYNYGFETYEESAAAKQILSFEDKNVTVDGRFSFGLDNKNFNGFIGVAYYRRTQDFISTSSYNYFGDDVSKSQAVYGEIFFSPAEKINIIAGGRVEKEEQSRNFNMIIGARELVDDLETDKTLFLPSLVIQYEATENTTLSLGARKGYNAGGGALSFAAGEYYYYDQESVITYEASSRSSFNDGKINLTANLFYNDFEGYQGLDGNRRITNIEDATTYGLEIEASAQVTPSLSLNGGLGLLKTEIKEAAADFGDIIGNELNSAPNITANIGARYQITEAFALGVSGTYVDEYFGDVANTEGRIAGGYFLTRLNLEYQTENWKLSAFVNNALNEKELTIREPAGGAYPVGYAAIVDPRNFGVSLTYSF